MEDCNDRKETLNDFAVSAMKNRAKRMLRLMECNAPSVILYNEASILFKHAQMLGNGKFHAEKVKHDCLDEFTKRKNYYEVCASDKCENHCFEEMEIDGLQYCGDCYDEISRKKAQDDLEVEAMFRNLGDPDFGNLDDSE